MVACKAAGKRRLDSFPKMGGGGRRVDALHATSMLPVLGSFHLSSVAGV